jgi:hypothetical protein
MTQWEPKAAQRLARGGQENSGGRIRADGWKGADPIPCFPCFCTESAGWERGRQGCDATGPAGSDWSDGSDNQRSSSLPGAGLGNGGGVLARGCAEAIGEVWLRREEKLGSWS